MQTQEATNVQNKTESTTMAKPDHQASAASANASDGKRGCRPFTPGSDDEVDVMLKHEDFKKLLALVAKVQVERKRISATMGSSHKTQRILPTSRPSHQETVQAALCLQDHLLSSPNRPRNTIYRGDYPITDAIIDDSIRLLQSELKDMERVFRKERGDSNSRPKCEEVEEQLDTSKKPSGKKKEAIAIKYSKKQTDILMTWMIEHKDQPFPDQPAIEQLMAQTGLSHSQVVNWTTNVRKRNRKATCQGGKKPHHFIDFLFLAQDREARQNEVQENEPAKKRQQKKHVDTLLLDDEPALHPEQPVSLSDSAPMGPKSPLGSLGLISNECFHPSMFDDDILEPLDCSAVDLDDSELLKEFADVWLGSDHGTSAVEPLEDVGVHDLIMKHGTVQEVTADEQALLPSVTDDCSSEDTSHYQILSPGRGRSSSFDFEFEGDEDMESWAYQFGLTI